MKANLKLKAIGTGLFFAMMAGATHAYAQSSVSNPPNLAELLSAKRSPKLVAIETQRKQNPQAVPKNLQMNSPMYQVLKARGGETGGGGGLIVKNNQVKTLPEAGIIIERASNLESQLPETQAVDEIYTVSSATKSELTRIISQFPFEDISKKDMFSKVLGKRGVLLSRQNIDSKEYQEIANDYAKALGAYGRNLDRSSFELAAVSKKGKTYILPNFDRLNSEQQALILIHEHFMRVSASDSGMWESPRLSPDKLLPIVLEFDGQLYKMLQSVQANTEFDFSRMVKAMQELGFVGEDLASNMLTPAVLIRRQKQFGVITLNDLVLEPKKIDTFHTRSEINPSVLKKTSGQDGKFFQFFAKASVLYRDKSNMSAEAKKEMRSLGPICEEYLQNDHIEKVEGDRVIYVSPESRTIFALACQEKDFAWVSGTLLFERITPTY